jgi:putative ABC transport system ATP-binding protein
MVTSHPQSTRERERGRHDMAMGTVLEARDLTKRYETDGATVDALAGMSLAVAAGEFVAIMGPSGCGKSTLLHLLGGLDRPTSGEVYLAGERVDRLSEAQWARRRRSQIGYVFQFFNLIENLTAADNVELPALMAGASARAAREARVRLMEELGVASRASLPPARLSGGEQQRVAIARALVNEPAVLLADEPTGNLDTAATREVLALLKRYHDRGQTMVMVTHDARVAATADRVVRMRDGRLAAETSLTGDRGRRSLVGDLIDMEL